MINRASDKMATNNYFGFTHNGTQYSALSATAYAAPAQTAYVQQTQTAYMATPRAQTYEAYQTPHAAQQYAYSAVGARTQVVAPVVQATPPYDATKTYYTPIANVTPGAAASATVYALPTDTTYQTNKFQPLYDSTKKYYPVAPVAAPPAVPTTMYTVTAEPIYQTLAVANSKSVYVPNTYTTQNQGRQITAVKIHSSLPTSIPSYAYHPPTQVSVIPAVTVTVTATTPKAVTMAPGPTVVDAAIYSGNTAYQTKFSAVSSSAGSSGASPANAAPSAPHQSKKPFHFHHRQRVTPKAPQLHYCDVCKISCAGPQTYREHLEGQKHKKKEASAKASASSTNSASNSSRGGGLAQLHCKMCDVACTGADTYAAHVRGAKHQKVLKLHASLGKPIPASELPSMKKISSSEDNMGSSSKSGSTQSKQDNYQGSSNDKSKGSKLEDDNGGDLEAILRSEKDVQPVGQEYIDEARNETGTAVSFYCKLCDCKFTDPNAKIMHMKGRRHRLQYKKKVDPSLQVDVKPLYGRRGLQHEDLSHGHDGSHFRRRQYEDKMRMEWEQRRYEEEMLEYHRQMNPAIPVFGLKMAPARRPDGYNDRHVMAKHTTIYPSAVELEAVQLTISTVEKALQLVSDHLAAANGLDADSRPVKGIMRVGPVAKGLLLHGNLDIELVVLCKERPTRSLLENVVDNATKQLAEIADNEYKIEMCVENAGFVVLHQKEPTARCTVSLTSPIVREQLMSESSGAALSDPPDVLDRQKCLIALAELRHAKWFQAKASGQQSCLVIIRIMRDFCKRIPTWAVLEGWPLELLVEKCVSSSCVALSPGDALRRVFECIASGIILPGGPGLFDPCEKDHVDALANISDQQKEDLTASAQQALRLIAFQQIHSVLGMEQLPPQNGSNPLPRKRQRSEDDASAEDDAKMQKQE